MAVVVKAPLINSTAWTKMLRGLWLSLPTASSAIAIVRMLVHMAQSALELTKQIEGDAFTRRGMKGWDRDFTALIERLEWYQREITRAIATTPPNVDADTGPGFKFVPSPDRVAVLTAHVIGPVLNGRFPVDFPAVVDPGPYKSVEELVAVMRRGLKPQPDGTWRGMPDAAAAVSLWNRAVEVLAVDAAQKEAGLPWLPDALREWVSQAEVDLQQSAPGEPATTADGVVKALEVIKQKALELLKFAGRGLGKVLVVAAGAFGLYVGYRVMSQPKERRAAR